MASDIVRFVDDQGIEYYTITETGEAGMSVSGLSQFCGVSRAAIHRHFTVTSLDWKLDTVRVISVTCLYRSLRLGLHQIVESLPQALHLIFCPVMPFRGRDSLGPFFTVWVDPHFGQLGTSDRTDDSLGASDRTFSKGCFLGGAVIGAESAIAFVLSCAIVASSSPIRLTALSKQLERLSTFPVHL